MRDLTAMVAVFLGPNTWSVNFIGEAASLAVFAVHMRMRMHVHIHSCCSWRRSLLAELIIRNPSRDPSLLAESSVPFQVLLTAALVKLSSFSLYLLHAAAADADGHVMDHMDPMRLMGPCVGSARDPRLWPPLVAAGAGAPRGPTDGLVLVSNTNMGASTDGLALLTAESPAVSLTHVARHHISETGADADAGLPPLIASQWVSSPLHDGTGRV